MAFSKRFQGFLLVLGDLALFYLGLYLTLALRYGPPIPAKIWHLHQLPFFIIYLIWVLIFYISGLYDLKKFYSLKAGFGQIAKAMTISLIMAILIFYAVPAFKITPKTNLIINGVLAGFLLLLWRKCFWNLASRASKIKILFFGYSEEAKTLIESFKTHPQLGYETAAIMARPIERDLKEAVKEHDIQLIVAAREIMNDPKASKHLYEALLAGISIMELPDFYEQMVKMPLNGDFWEGSISVKGYHRGKYVEGRAFGELIHRFQIPRIKMAPVKKNYHLNDMIKVKFQIENPDEGNPLKVRVYDIDANNQYLLKELNHIEEIHIRAGDLLGMFNTKAYQFKVEALSVDESMVGARVTKSFKIK